MLDEEIILLETYCSYYNIELSFIESLETFGLLTVRYEDNKRFIFREEINSLEKFSRMYYDLNINVPGIDALSHLLEKIKDLQHETEILKARLRIYE
jgi:MerR HTH family regulatory protein